MKIITANEVHEKIVKDLKETGKAVLGKTCTIEVKDRKSKRAYDVNNKKHHTLPKGQRFKFTASKTLKRKVLKLEKLLT